MAPQQLTPHDWRLGLRKEALEVGVREVGANASRLAAPPSRMEAESFFVLLDGAGRRFGHMVLVGMGCPCRSMATVDKR